MEPTPTTSEPTPASTPTEKPPKKGSWGGLIGILLIVLAIIVGAFYSWGERIALDEARTAESAE